MKPTKTKSFDAVTESRRRKEAVSRKTQGMTPEEVLAFFSKERALVALEEMRGREDATSVVREDPSEP